MRILAIETSCDDTGIAVLETSDLPAQAGKRQATRFNVLSNIVSSQIKVHKKYGGVFPMMAKREHQKNLVPVLIKALKQAKLLNSSPSQVLRSKIWGGKLQILNSVLEREPELLKRLLIFLKKYGKPKVDLIAVTQGPGLEPCLWVGVNFAKALSYFWDIPIVPVNHIEAHILVNFFGNKQYHKSHGREKMGTILTAVCLVVSGGHTQLILMKGIGKYEIIGETRDDAAGECFDKAAKILGLGYPGGPIISKLASKLVGSPTPHHLPRPMINTKDYDFSFSGLKTAVLYLNQKPKIKNQKYIQEMCFEVQQAIIDILIKKTIKAAKDFKAKTIILGGGVSANQELRKQINDKLQETSNKINLLVPPVNLSTDNALMIAITGYFNRTQKIKWQKLKAQANLRIS